MVENLNIGLNPSTVILINVLITTFAIGLTIKVESVGGVIRKLAFCITSLSLLTLVVLNLPHEPLM